MPAHMVQSPCRLHIQNSHDWDNLVVKFCCPNQDLVVQIGVVLFSVHVHDPCQLGVAVGWGCLYIYKAPKKMLFVLEAYIVFLGIKRAIIQITICIQNFILDNN